MKRNGGGEGRPLRLLANLISAVHQPHQLHTISVYYDNANRLRCSGSIFRLAGTGAAIALGARPALRLGQNRRRRRQRGQVA